MYRLKVFSKLYGLNVITKVRTTLIFDPIKSLSMIDKPDMPPCHHDAYQFTAYRYLYGQRHIIENIYVVSCDNTKFFFSWLRLK